MCRIQVLPGQRYSHQDQHMYVLTNNHCLDNTNGVTERAIKVTIKRL